MDKERDESLRHRNWSAKLREESVSSGNPRLKKIEEQSAEFNARVHQALAEIPVPPNLREQILARNKIIRVRGWRQHRPLMAIAAALVLLGALVAIWLRPREDLTYAGFRSRMVAFAVRQYSMDLHTNQLAAVQAYLARKGAPAEFALPSGLASRPVIGGASLSWQGKPVSMVCFSAVGGQTLYLFVISSADTAGASPEFNINAQKDLGTAIWSAEGKTFLVAGEVPLQELEKLIRS